MNQSESKLISVRVPLEVAEWLSKQAKSNFRTLSGEALKILEDARRETKQSA